MPAGCPVPTLFACTVHHGRRLLCRRRLAGCAGGVGCALSKPSTAESAEAAASPRAAAHATATRQGTAVQLPLQLVGAPSRAAHAASPAGPLGRFHHSRVSAPERQSRARIPQIHAVGVQRYTGRLWARPDDMRPVSEVPCSVRLAGLEGLACVATPAWQLLLTAPVSV